MRNSAMQKWLDDYCGTSEGVVGGTVMVSNPDGGALALAEDHHHHFGRLHRKRQRRGDDASVSAETDHHTWAVRIAGGQRL